MKVTEEMVERAARAYCEAEGVDADGEIYDAEAGTIVSPAWHYYQTSSRAALEAALSLPSSEAGQGGKMIQSGWSLSMNYGPDGYSGEYYASLITPEGEYVSVMKVHHARRIIDAFDTLAAPPEAGQGEALEPRCPKCGAQVDERFDCCEVHEQSDVALSGGLTAYMNELAKVYAENDELQAALAKAQETNQRQYDEGYKHGLSFAKAQAAVPVAWRWTAAHQKVWNYTPHKPKAFPGIIVEPLYAAPIASKPEWRDVVGFEELYEVSSTGDVRSKSSGKVLAKSLAGLGYQKADLWKDNVRTQTTVHRVVARAFLGEAPADFEVNHKDGNKLNNRVENLEWVSHSDNVNHSYYDLGQLTKPIVGTDIKTGETVEFGSATLAGRSGYNPRHIWSCISGKRKSHLGKTWAYAAPPTPSDGLLRKALNALEKIACFRDKFASQHLKETGSYGMFDEPQSVGIARAALTEQEAAAKEGQKP